MQQILVVEDEADIRELLRFNLEREGFGVLEAADGPQALELARRHIPALVLLDVMLPASTALKSAAAWARRRKRPTSPSSCSRPGAKKWTAWWA